MPIAAKLCIECEHVLKAQECFGPLLSPCQVWWGSAFAWRRGSKKSVFVFFTGRRCFDYSGGDFEVIAPRWRHVAPTTTIGLDWWRFWWWIQADDHRSAALRVSARWRARDRRSTQWRRSDVAWTCTDCLRRLRTWDARGPLRRFRQFLLLTVVVITTC